MGTMMIAFRIAEGPDYQIKRNRLHQAVMKFFGANQVFDELTSLYVVQSNLPAQSVASLFSTQAGLTQSDKLLVLSGEVGHPGTSGVLQQAAKLMWILQRSAISSLFSKR
jgi:hypothetical protein